MNQITDQIWLGGSDSTGDASRLRSLGIRHILNCAEDLNDRLGWSDGFTTFHCGMRDGSNNPRLYHAAASILGAIVEDKSNKVVVHCHEGRSRSAFVIALHLVERGMFSDTHAAEEFLKAKRHIVCINDGHRRSLGLP